MKLLNKEKYSFKGIWTRKTWINCLGILAAWLTILTVLTSCAKVQNIPYDRVIRNIDDACIHPDKDKMIAIYGGYLEEIFEKCEIKKSELMKKE